MSVKLQWHKRDSAKAPFAMDEHAFVVPESSKFMGFDFVFLGI
jgi:hypothetical protein